MFILALQDDRWDVTQRTQMAKREGGLANAPLEMAQGLPRTNFSAVLNALAEAVIVIDRRDTIGYVNPAAEQMFRASASQLRGVPLERIIPFDHPLFSLIRQVRRHGHSLSEYDVSLESARFSAPAVMIQLAPVQDGGDVDDGLERGSDDIVIVIHPLSIAQKIDQQLTHRNAARSVAGMAAVLAHEVKNPLAGIRGAAQLVEQNVTAADRELTRLICDEADRICALVDRMEAFSDRRVTEREVVNIHEVLEHVRRVALASFGRRVRIVEQYDPSLPPVLGSRDRLVQVFMNLVKNAVDAAPVDGGEVVMSTAYRHGVRLAVNDAGGRVVLPLVVSVQDNGHGVPDDLARHLFDPFVTTKPGGQGLGLALVAKIVDEHGGVIEFDSEPRKTIFSVLLPIHSAAAAAE